MSSSTDYLRVSDLSKPATPLQAQLDKIDSSIIKGTSKTPHQNKLTLFETTVLAFRDIIVRRLWKSDNRFQSESEFCKHEWNIQRSRRNELIECAELLVELSRIPWRPVSEAVCRVLSNWTVKYQHEQPSLELGKTTVSTKIWTKVLDEWRTFRGLEEGDKVDVQNITPEYVHTVLSNLEQAHIQKQQQHKQQQEQQQQQLQQQQLQQQLQQRQLQILQHHNPNAPTGQTPPLTLTPGGSNSPATNTSNSTESTSSSLKSKIEGLMEDPRRFHAPSVILSRVRQLFNGAPQLDPAYFEGSTLGSPISIPFPDIMDCDTWRIPYTLANGIQGFSPIQSCFMHVPIVPSKRIIETDTEVILLDDVRLCGQLNAKLWEEFSSGNVIEAVSIIPASATWFPKTELADWPCVVMSGLKFEQMDTENQNEKKYSEIHSYIAVYLGRDPLRQSQFVQLFQDLGVSSLSTGGVSSATSGGQRWLAGFRRLSRAQGSGSGFASSGASFSSPSAQAQGTDIYGAGHDSLDPEFDDIYSIRPPNKKPRLERAGRPSDAQAAWHHSKRRKMDDFGFSKLKGHDTWDKKWSSDDEMSE